MSRNIIRIYLSLMFTFGCVAISGVQEKIPDEIYIYKISQFKKYLVGVNCENVKSMEGVFKFTLFKEKEIKKLYSLLENNNNFTEDTALSQLDSRILIEYRKRGQVIKRICWSNIERMERDGKVYSYNKPVEDYLLSKKLIVKMNK